MFKKEEKEWTREELIEGWLKLIAVAIPAAYVMAVIASVLAALMVPAVAQVLIIAQPFAGASIVGFVLLAYFSAGLYVSARIMQWQAVPTMLAWILMPLCTIAWLPVLIDEWRVNPESWPWALKGIRACFT